MTLNDKIGVMGGSGFSSLIADPERVSVQTQYGEPSGEISIGRISGRDTVFIPRHGALHTYPPHKVPYRANIDALYGLGVRRLIASSAVGSLVPEYEPGDFVFFDQFVNMTHGREDTFYDSNKVVHISTADPYCPEMRSIAADAAGRLGLKYHDTGTVVVVNGPRFSTRAESRFFMGQGFQLINMTQYPEVALARERGMCYLGIGIVTDYDAGLEGRSDIKHVTFDELSKNFAAKVNELKELIPKIIASLPEERKACVCADALKGATATTG